jgi:hypothetical protein
LEANTNAKTSTEHCSAALAKTPPMTSFTVAEGRKSVTVQGVAAVISAAHGSDQICT